MVQVKKGLLLLLKEEIFLLLLPTPLCFPIEYNKAIKNCTKFDDWYLWVQMYKGTVSMPVFQSLEAYWPGLQVGAVIPCGDFCSSVFNTEVLNRTLICVALKVWLALS